MVIEENDTTAASAITDPQYFEEWLSAGCGFKKESRIGRHRRAKCVGEDPAGRQCSVRCLYRVSTLEDQRQIHREQHEMHSALHHVGSPARERDDTHDEG